MNTQLLLENEKRMLNTIICVCQGREKQLLDILLGNYPLPTSITDVCKQLDINQNNLMYSILRNTRIFIDIDTIKYQGKPTHLAFGQQMMNVIKGQCLFNQCACAAIPIST